MHPLCCISIDCPGIGHRSPAPVDSEPDLGGAGEGSSSAVAVAGVLYKWTNLGKGWRSRWFFLRNGVLSYSKIPRREEVPLPEGDGVRLIGTAATRLSRANASGGCRNPPKPLGVVYLKISSFQESKTDERRFYIFSPTKTLQLRTDSKEDRIAWIEALVTARSKFSLDGRISFIQNDISISTKRLRDRMHVEGLDEVLMKDCEQIMLSEFSEFQRQSRLRYEEHLHFLGTFQQQLEEVNADEVTATIHEGQLQLLEHECSCSGHGKCNEYGTTESSDDVEKQEIDELSDKGEPYFFDTEESFGDSTVVCLPSLRDSEHANKSCGIATCSGTVEMTVPEIGPNNHHKFPYISRRTKLPDPVEKENGVSLWSVIKDNVGKDLTRVCLPVYFNEPLSTLQKCFEDLEYSYLLDQAYEYGKMGNSLLRILNVAVFAVSGYASSYGRHCKPFNPLLGETYEADFPEKGIHFLSEKVSHHPTLLACHCEGKGWKFWGDIYPRSKFWGQTIQLDPVGVLTLQFDDGEIFQWSKVTTTIYNLILGKVYCNHHGIMSILGNQQYSCKLKFKYHSLFERNPRQVQGFIEDVGKTKVATLLGKWDDSMYYTIDDDISKTKGHISTQNATLLWKRSKPPANPTRYNLSSFAITLNELTSELQEKLPPTDSRLRPDQRCLENGEYDKANAEKQRLEKRQRIVFPQSHFVHFMVSENGLTVPYLYPSHPATLSRKLQDNGWKPRWFRKDCEDGTFRYIGGYWEARNQKKWDACPDIFGDFSEDQNVTLSN